MNEAQFNYLIRVAAEFKEAGNVEAKIQAINQALSGAGKDAPKVSAKLETIAQSMRGLGLSQEQVKNTFAALDTNKVKLTANELDSLKKSLLASGATKPQISALMKSLDAKGVIPVKEMGDFERALRRAAIVAPVWMALRFAMQSVMTLVRDQIKFLIDLETAMARIRIVGKGTEEQYNRLQSSLITLSVLYGTVASAALDSALIFAQQGKSIDEIISLTRTAMIGSQVLGADMKTTVDDITAAVNGFNININDSISIIDKWINVEKQFAVTSKDLADATKRTGATANQLGISINAFLGDVTAVIEVTRQSGQEAARGLQFIYARLLTTGAKTINQIAKVPIYLDKQNKATFALTNTYRTVTDVLDDVAAGWNTLTNKEKLSIATSVASKRQLTVFMALMQNYEASLKARIAALTSAGQAETAFGIIQETTKIKIDRLASSWNNLTAAVADTSGFKGLLDALSMALLNYTAIINKQSAIKMAHQEVIDANKKESETQISLAQNLMELIELRNKYLTSPPTDKNKKMLEDIEKAINNIQKHGGYLGEIDIDTSIADEKIKKWIDTARREQIRFEVNVETESDRKVLEDKIKKLKEDLKPKTILHLILSIPSYKSNLDKIKSAENELVTINEKNNILMDERLSKYETEKTLLEARKTDEDLDNSAKLLDYEKEKIVATERLNWARKSEVFTNEELLDLELSMIDALNEFENIHERAIKLTELEEQRRQAIIDDLEKESSIRSKILSYLGENEINAIKQEMSVKQLINGEEYLFHSLEDRLRLAEAITKEVEEQEKSSSRIVELFKIYQKYGSAVAKEISRYLGGDLSAQQLSSNALRALKKYGGGEFETVKAERFFAQTSPGFIFPEEINRERKAMRNFDIIQAVTVNPMSLNVNIDSELITEKVKQKINEELDKKKSELNLKINRMIEEF